MAGHRNGPDWDAFFEKREALVEEIEPVIQATGIERYLECLEDDLMPDWFEDRHLPPRSPTLRNSNNEQDETRWNTRNYGLRKMIFGLKDEGA